MRTPYRIATTLVAMAAVFPIGLGTAHADQAEPSVVQGAWYWADQKVIVGPEVLTPPAQATGVPDKDLAVAFKGNDGTNPDKVTYLAWDVSMIPQGAMVTRFEFTIAVETDPGAVQIPAPDYKLVACGAVGDFSPASGAGFNERPADDCGAASNGRYDATAKTWTFDVAPYANAWAHGDPPSGIGILPAPGTTTPFQVVFEPASTVKTKAEWTPPAPVVATPTIAPVVPVQPPTFTDTNVGSGVAQPPYVPVQQPVAQPAPTPAPPAVALAPVRPVVPARGVTFPKSSGLPASFWGGALAAVGLLGIASLVLGDATVVQETKRGRTVTRSLRDRQVAQRGTLSRTRTRVRTV